MRSLQEAIQAAHRGSQSSIPCPAHDDSNPSLSVGPGDSQDVVLKCFAGCTAEEILTAEGLEWADICRPREDPTGVEGEWTPRGTASHIYDYTDSEGNLIFQVLRVPQAGGKTFTQRHWDDEEGKWAWSVRGLPKPLYRLVEVERAVQAGKVIYITEGEKDVEVLRSQGMVATTSVGGAGKWSDENSETLAGCEVIIWADADEAGQKHAREVASSLVEHDCRVKVIESTIAKDASDHYARGGTVDTAVEVWNSHPERKNQTGMGIRLFLRQDWGEDTEIIPGHLAHSNVVILTGWEGQGKALAYDTPLPTPDGWTVMGRVRIGDQLIGSDGKPCTITNVSGLYEPERLWRVEFSDGTTLLADGAHQWVTYTQRAREAEARLVRTGGDYTPKRRPSVVSTDEIRQSMDLRHSVKVTQPLDLPEADLPIDPYTLGVWLGDGTSADGRVTIGLRDRKILDGIQEAGYELGKPHEMDSAVTVGVLGLKVALRDAGLLNRKYIPFEYLRASREQRMALLAGICDTDGWCSATAGQGQGQGAAVIEVVSISMLLADSIMELLSSLGIKAQMRKGDAVLNGRRVSDRYRITFQSPFNPFRYSDFKAERWYPLRTARALHRYIVSVTEVDPVPVQCVEVDSPDHTYLAGERMVVTHNSMFLRQLAATAASGINMLANFAPMAPLKVLYLDAENPEHQLALEWRQIITLADRVSGGPTDETLILMNEWEAEPDLASHEGQAWLNERISAYRPDLCIMGPVQNLVSRDVKDDEVVRRLKRAINTARSICGTAFLLEHHAPHRASGDKERTVRPYGSSLFLKWPDYGYGLRPDPDREGVFDLVANRKPRVRKRAWPSHFKQGDMTRGEWPWEPFLDERGARVIHGGWGA